MELLILILIIVSLLLNASLFCYCIGMFKVIEKEIIGYKEDNIQEPAKVSDNYERPKEILQPTDHIIIPKTPQEIRNQNYNKLKEGIEYGDIAKR